MKKQNKDKGIKEELKKLSNKLNDIDRKIVNLKEHNKIETNSFAIAGMLMAILYTVITGVVIQDMYYIKGKIGQNIMLNNYDLFTTIVLMVILFLMVFKSIDLFNVLRRALRKELVRIEEKKKK